MTEDVDSIRHYFERPDRAWSRWPRGRAYLVEERRRILLRFVNDMVGTSFVTLTVLDVGCGEGAELAFWRNRGVEPENLAGTELMAHHAAAARVTLPLSDIRLVDSFSLPFGDGAFKLTMAALVLSTVTSDAARRRLFDEMQRVTCSGGLVAIYDFRVRKPTNRRVVALSSRRLRALGRVPDAKFAAAPFLPALDAFLRLPAAIARRLIRLLPRTHALWVWQRP